MKNHATIVTLMVFVTVLAGSVASSAQTTFQLPEGPVTGWIDQPYTQSVIGLTQEAENDLGTSNPSTFTGPSVGGLIGADRFYDAGITGQGTIVANVEAGHIWDGHETLGHVSNFSHHPDAYGSSTSDLYDRHATWVGMMIGGRGMQTYQTGIAPDTDLRSGAIATSWSGSAYSLSFTISESSFTAPMSTYFGTADVINSSWGFTDAGGSGSFTVAMDGYAAQNPNTTFVVSAGNSGPSSNTVGSPGAGYNAVTVAALANDGANNYDSVASFSSRGPQDYRDPENGTISGVRAAVDIAAPGNTLTSAYYGGQTGGNNSTLTGSPSGDPGGPTYYAGGLGGTSFASPITAGSVALLDSAAKADAVLATNIDARDTRVLKAVLQNSAEKISGWDNGQVAHPNGNGGVQTTQSLDWASGAGAVDMDAAYDQYVGAGTRDVAGTTNGDLGSVDVIGWDFGNVADGTSNLYQIGREMSGGSTFNATLTWFRDRAFNADTFTVTDYGQANLDLLLTDINSGQTISESISNYNVVEHLSFTLPGDSLYQIEVVFAGMNFDERPGGTGDVFYGLAWSGVAVPEPGSILLLLSAAIAGLIVCRRPALKQDG